MIRSINRGKLACEFYKSLSQHNTINWKNIQGTFNLFHHGNKQIKFNYYLLKEIKYGFSTRPGR
jgi:hypothetical protein